MFYRIICNLLKINFSQKRTNYCLKKKYLFELRKKLHLLVEFKCLLNLRNKKMIVYKFGGASVKSADAIRNLLNIIKLINERVFVIVSAMNKTTNELEELLNRFYSQENLQGQYGKIYKFHFQIMNELFSPKSSIWLKINAIFDELKEILKEKKQIPYDVMYDRIVPFGELISTTIISTFLTENGVENQWIDARKFMITDDNHRVARVNFEKTNKKLKELVDFQDNKIYITQGFIGATEAGISTTLGREGSDYTAAVVANLLDANSLTLWKDVAGIYNDDPKTNREAVKLEKISYREATELAYFGAKVIHPKTAKPLMNKGIPLLIRSFLKPDENGTIVGNFDKKILPVVPVFITNENQVLLTLSAFDFEFINENFLEKVFAIFNRFKIKINLMQNSALNLSLCIDYNENNFDNLITELKKFFNVKYNKNLTLLTIRHFSEKNISEKINDKKIFMEQKNRLNAFFVIDEKG